LTDELKVAPGAKLLDVPCGGGRHAIGLAKQGYELTAVDISKQFLEAARTAAIAQNVNISWYEREMRDLPWSAEFDGAYSFGNSFGYLAGEENDDFLRSIWSTLKSGGKFVLDTSYLAEGLFANLQERAWYPDGDNLVLASRRYDAVEGRLHVTYTFVDESGRQIFDSTIRVHTCRELIEKFTKLGFVDIQTYSSTIREPFKLGSTRLLIVGTKP
jgi:SAM-dependent methyltransferase